MPNIEVYPDNRLELESVLELGVQHVIVATGSSWRSDGIGRWRATAFDGYDHTTVISVDRILAGELPQGRVIIYDDDHYYLSSAIALKLRALALAVTLVTPEARIAGWSAHTEEQYQTLKALYEADVRIVTDKGLVSWNGSKATLECVFSGVESSIEADYLIPLTARLPNDALFTVLRSQQDQFHAMGGKTIQGIGDCIAPGIIAAAIYSGHQAARELGDANAGSYDVPRDTILVNNLESGS
jgi:dimethylamine/trimethylamine dehydrogenase